MLLPVGIEHTIKRLPPVTIAIIAICTIVQIYNASSGEDIAEPLLRFGYVTGSGVSYTLITSTFIHAGWLHLVGNMLFLWLCGAALEDRWGSLKFAAFYVFGAVASTLAFDVAHSGDPTLLVGASGAISALMGAFLVHFTHTQIRILYWFWRAAGTFLVAAYYALPLWLLEQVLWHWRDPGGEVAYTAHIGGFIAGFAVAFVRLPKRVPKPRPAPAPQPARVPVVVVEPPKPVAIRTDEPSLLK